MPAQNTFDLIPKIAIEDMPLVLFGLFALFALAMLQYFRVKIQAEREKNRLQSALTDAQDTINQLVLKERDRNATLSDRLHQTSNTAIEASTDARNKDAEAVRLRTENEALKRRIQTAEQERELLYKQMQREGKVSQSQQLNQAAISAVLKDHIQLLEGAILERDKVIDTYRRGETPNEAFLNLESLDDLRQRVAAGNRTDDNRRRTNGQSSPG